MNQNSEKVFSALKKDPSLMQQFLNGKGAEVVHAVINGTPADEKEVLKDVTENAVMQMYVGGRGEIDAAELLELTGGFTKGAGSNPTNNPGVEALLTGEATADEMLKLRQVVNEAPTRAGGADIMSTLLGLLSQNQGNQQQVQNSNTTLTTQQLNQLATLVYNAARNQNTTQTVTLSAGQLNCLLRAYGVNTSVKPNLQVQQQNSGQSLTDILNMLTGAGTTQQQTQQSSGLGSLFGLGNTQQQTQQSSGLGNLFGLGNTQQQTQQSSGLGNLFGLGGTQQNSGGLVNGQSYSLGGSSGSSGGSSLGTLFNLAGQLLGH